MACYPSVFCQGVTITFCTRVPVTKSVGPWLFSDSQYASCNQKHKRHLGIVRKAIGDIRAADYWASRKVESTSVSAPLFLALSFGSFWLRRQSHTYRIAHTVDKNNRCNIWKNRLRPIIYLNHRMFDRDGRLPRLHEAIYAFTHIDDLVDIGDAAHAGFPDFCVQTAINGSTDNSKCFSEDHLHSATHIAMLLRSCDASRDRLG
jgi:hypothetical protein